MKVCIYSLLFALSLLPLHALDGIDYYYGIGVEQDYHRALAEFQKETDPNVDIIFQLLIYLNGDGVQPNAAKALEIWRLKYGKDDLMGVTAESLKDIIDERIAHPANKYPHLTFEDIALCTVDMNESAFIADRIQKDRQVKLSVLVEKRLTEQQLKYWSKLKRLVEQIADLDSNRVYLQYIDGTIRTAYCFGMRYLIVDNFLNRSTRWLLEKPVICGAGTLLEADDKLNRSYQLLARTLEIKYKIMLQDTETRDKYSVDLKDMVSDLKQSQQLWVVYRDTWLEMLGHSFIKDRNEKLLSSCAVELTNDRIAELEFPTLNENIDP